MTTAPPNDRRRAHDTEIRALHGSLTDLVELDLSVTHIRWNLLTPHPPPAHVEHPWVAMRTFTDRCRVHADRLVSELRRCYSWPDARASTVAQTGSVLALPPGPYTLDEAVGAASDRVTALAARFEQRAERSGAASTAGRLLLGIAAGMCADHEELFHRWARNGTALRCRDDGAGRTHRAAPML